MVSCLHWNFIHNKGRLHRQFKLILELPSSSQLLKVYIIPWLLYSNANLFLVSPPRNMVIALKELSIRGDFRTTVEYLVKLLETEKFQNNMINTGWLDHLIAEKVQVGFVQ